MKTTQELFFEVLDEHLEKEYRFRMCNTTDEREKWAKHLINSMLNAHNELYNRSMGF